MSFVDIICTISFFVVFVLTLVGVHCCSVLSQQRHRVRIELQALMRLYETRPAVKRARELLFSKLTKQQQENLSSKGYFSVIGKSGNQYLLTAEIYSNIFILELGDENNDVLVKHAQYCLVPEANIPISDQLLSQMLHLRYDDLEFMKKAKRT